MRVGIFILFMGLLTHPVFAGHKLPETLAQAHGAIIFDQCVDRFILEKTEVFDPALEPTQLFHGRDAKFALDRLAWLQQKIYSKVTPLDLALDDRIDWVLLRLTLANTADQLQAALTDEEALRQLFPAADLRERLPDLTGLLAADALSKTQRTLNQAAAQIPNAAPTTNTRVAVLNTAVARAQLLVTELDLWLPRAKDRFGDQAGPMEAQIKAIKERLDQYQEILNKALEPLKEQDAAYGAPVGEARFVSLLRHKHMISQSPDEILKTGEANLVRIQTEIAQICRRINPKATPAEVWEQVSNEHPSREDLPTFAHKEMLKSLKLLREKDAVTIPDYAGQDVMFLTEGDTWQTYPFGGYGGYSARGSQMEGIFLTSPPKRDTPPEDAKARLMGNNYYWARVVAVHEMYPGHHLAFITARDNTRPMRRLFYTETFGEGWGLYSEQMLYRLGFMDDDKTLLALKKMRAWRAARMVIDVSLHLGRMTADQAVAFLMKHVDMNRENARAEVRRYLGNATRPMSYFYGYLQIEALRADFQAKQGKAFTEKAFHDALLSYGGIPIPLIRAGMLGEPVPQPQIATTGQGKD